MKRTLLWLIAAGTFVSSPLAVAKPTVQQALQLRPMQADVDYDRPEGDEVQKCRLSATQGAGQTAWVVQGPAGELLRRFVDSNGDHKVDQWCYYKSGVEVYRDIDDDFNGKADQYRWFGMAGTRWGLDKNEDGRIDAWKVISAEEVTAEVVAAIRSGDTRRFQSVLLKPGELSSLGLGKKLAAKLSERMQTALDNFEKVTSKQDLVGKDTQWIDFGGLRPGTIPAGTDGSTRDVTVYENVVAMIETQGKPAQLPLGSLIRVGNGWRLITLPLASESDDVTPQFVFYEAATQPSLEEPAASAGFSDKTQKLVEKLEKIDARLAEAREAAELSRLNGQRADTLEQLAADASDPSDRDMWLMQLIDTVGAAAQTGTFPEGAARLSALREKLEETSENEDLLAHLVYTHMSSEYAMELQGPDVDFAEVQQRWLEQLQQFVEKYPLSQNAPEAMLQLALAKEFAGEDDEANRTYTRIVEDFPKSPLVSKAAGAKRRLESVGKPLALTGRAIDGKSFDLEALRGDVVLVHYWASWCEPCKEDMEVLAKLKRQFAGQRFQIVGVNLDSDPAEVTAYLRAHPPQWIHLYGKGGLDGRLANQMGVFTLPVMLLIDTQGRVVNRQVHIGELEGAVKNLLRVASAAKASRAKDL